MQLLSFTLKKEHDREVSEGMIEREKVETSTVLASRLVSLRASGKRCSVCYSLPISIVPALVKKAFIISPLNCVLISLHIYYQSLHISVSLTVSKIIFQNVLSNSIPG